MNGPRIVLQDVAKRFTTANGSTLSAVDGISLTVNDGEFISIIGPSGCGKTTLLNMIAGFEQPSSGSITLDDKPVTRPGAERGVIFQEYGIFPWLTVHDNIAFGLSLRASRIPAVEHEAIVRRYVDLMGLRGFESAYPKTLSGGMKQRVALARAYAVRPEFLLMDEPFGALDAQTRTAMQDLLLHVLESEGKTVILITHSVDEALYLSSRVVVITARPARVRTILSVPFPYPRREEIRRQPLFADLQYSVREMVMREFAAQQLQRMEAAQGTDNQGALA
ncbi:MAG TPA: ABC transporter ATP-binding protein [Xanthobacteraceae bacterium]|jgi:NitT/TauT family transport system ATP-binding protein